jgi:hypothetical protein
MPMTHTASAAAFCLHHTPIGKGAIKNLELVANGGVNFFDHHLSFSNRNSRNE